MSPTTDECLTLAARALEAERQCPADDAHVDIPRKYTQPQRFALLVVRQSLGWTCRATATRLAEWSDPREAPELDEAPDPFAGRNRRNPPRSNGAGR